MYGRDIQSRIYSAGVFGRRPVVPTNPQALTDRGRAAMSGPARDYVETGAGLGSTMTANRAAFDRHRIVPRMLRDVSQRDQSIELFGVRHPSPFLTCPIGVLEMAHRDADLAVARAARAAQVPMIISSQASEPMEQIAAELGDHERWFQLYWSNQPAVVESFVRRAEAIGARAIVVTLDTLVLGWRTLDLDRGFLPFARGMGIAQYTSDPAFNEIAGSAQAPVVQGRPTPSAVRSLVQMSRRHPGSLADNLRSPAPRKAVQTFLDVFSKTDLTWDDLATLRAMTDLPIVVKGVQSADDAQRALDHGADGIYVSNHGGRQTDGAIASLDALEAVAPVVDGRVPVLFDSGIRCAADAFKALALGADAVGIGRPYVYGLAIAGSAGAQAVLEHFRAELDLQMANAGVRSIAEIDRSTLAG
ncbi:alpha-hydroxy-acid oxidizing protein [Calidifontibacter terrae]